MANPLIEGIQKTVVELIADSNIKTSIFPKAKFEPIEGFRKKGPFRESGIAYVNGNCEFWFELNENNICRIIISRTPLPLTRAEKRILGGFPNTIVGLLYPDSTRRHELTLKIASRLGFEHVLISSFLRGTIATNFWLPAFILLQLQELSYFTYESEPCTSGFIFTSQPKMYISRLEKIDNALMHFRTKISVSQEHFSKPAAYRYVDGKNSFFLIDNFLNIHGIVKVPDPTTYSRIDRSNLGHILPLIEHMPGRVWGAFIGKNRDVNVIGGGGMHLVWQKNHWHLIDKTIIYDLLNRFGCTQETTSILCSVVFTLSDLRKGCALLICRDSSFLPRVIGSIDDSTLAKALRDCMVSSKLSDLVRDQSIIGVLSSDGLTTVSSDGNIVNCGEIIDITKASNIGLMGGGRTQAAIAASYFGLAIKVSQDGPISVYQDGNKVIKLGG